MSLKIQRQIEEVLPELDVLPRLCELVGDPQLAPMVALIARAK